jgi:hypothetical protein
MPDRFDRFTDRARQVQHLAQEEAQQLKHNYIGTEDLLLGLLREEVAGGREAARSRQPRAHSCAMRHSLLTSFTSNTIRVTPPPRERCSHTSPRTSSTAAGHKKGQPCWSIRTSPHARQAASNTASGSRCRSGVNNAHASA